MNDTTKSSPRAKAHGVGACIRLGYKAYAATFPSILRSTWPYALAFGLAFGVLAWRGMALFVEQYAALKGMPLLLAPTAGLVATLAAAFVVGGLAELVVYGNGLSALAPQAAPGTLPRLQRWLPLPRAAVWRLLKAVLCVAVFALAGLLVVGGVAWALRACGMAGKSPVATWGLVALVAVAVALLLLPLAHVAMAYFQAPGARFWPSAPAGYKAGLRHYGSLFAVLLFCSVASAVASALLGLPALIVGTALAQSFTGTLLLGDETGVPGYMEWVSFAVFTLSGIVQAYLRLSLLFPLHFATAAIAQAEEERARLDKGQQAPATKTNSLLNL